MLKKIFKYLLFFILFFLFIYAFVYQLNVQTVIFQTIDLWFKKVIVSIIPVYIISSLIAGFPLLSCLLFKIIKKTNLFENQKALSLFLISFLTGNPTSVILITNSYKKNEITINQAKLLYSSSSFISPLFIFKMLNIKIALIIIISNLISSIIIYLVKAKKANLTYYFLKIDNNINNFEDNIFNIIDNLPNILLKILSSMLIISIIRLPFSKIIPNNYWYFIFDLLEISTGLYDISIMNISIVEQLLMANAIISLNGFAIILQVIYILKKEKLTIEPFIKGRIFALIISTIISLILYLILFVLLF